MLTSCTACSGSSAFAIESGNPLNVWPSMFACVSGVSRLTYTLIGGMQPSRLGQRGLHIRWARRESRLIHRPVQRARIRDQHPQVPRLQPGRQP